ncbi:MAG: hypothetical protein ACYCWW_11020 [Deltaproteobacteria bacterium]
MKAMGQLPDRILEDATALESQLRRIDLIESLADAFSMATIFRDRREAWMLVGASTAHQLWQVKTAPGTSLRPLQPIDYALLAILTNLEKPITIADRDAAGVSWRARCGKWGKKIKATISDGARGSIAFCDWYLDMLEAPEMAEIFKPLPIPARDGVKALFESMRRKTERRFGISIKRSPGRMGRLTIAAFYRFMKAATDAPLTAASPIPGSLFG